MLVKVAIFLGVASLSFGEETTEALYFGEFSHAERLGSKENYILFWKYNDTHVTFEAHVDTNGWVLLGLFPDMVIGWVSNDGTAHITDQHLVDGKFVKDTSQDWQLVYGQQIKVHTILKFVRKIDTGDKVGDKVIPRGTSQLIYAYGTEDLVSDNITTLHSVEHGEKTVGIFQQPSSHLIID